MSRFNIYHEEWAEDEINTELLTKVVNGRVFYGLRLYLATPNALLKHMAFDTDDDDRSAVTIWSREREKFLLLMREFDHALQSPDPPIAGEAADD